MLYSFFVKLFSCACFISATSLIGSGRPIQAQNARPHYCSTSNVGFQEIEARHQNGWCLRSYEYQAKKIVQVFTVTRDNQELFIGKRIDPGSVGYQITLNNFEASNSDLQTWSLWVFLDLEKHPTIFLFGDESVIDNYRHEINQGIALADIEYDRIFGNAALISAAFPEIVSAEDAPLLRPELNSCFQEDQQFLGGWCLDSLMTFGSDGYNNVYTTTEEGWLVNVTRYYQLQGTGSRYQVTFNDLEDSNIDFDFVVYLNENHQIIGSSNTDRSLILHHWLLVQDGIDLLDRESVK
jgi:hypothetical protein